MSIVAKGVYNIFSSFSFSLFLRMHLCAGGCGNKALSKNGENKGVKGRERELEKILIFGHCCNQSPSYKDK